MKYSKDLNNVIDDLYDLLSICRLIKRECDCNVCFYMLLSVYNRVVDISDYIYDMLGGDKNDIQ